MLNKIASVIPFPRRRIASDGATVNSGQSEDKDTIPTRFEEAQAIASDAQVIASDRVGPGLALDEITSETVFEVHGLTPRQRVQLFLKVVLAELDVMAKKQGCDRGDHMPQRRLHRRYVVMAKQCNWPDISQKALTGHLEKLGCKRIRLNDAARTTVIQLPK